MAFCNKCGTEIEEGSKVCPNCGEKLGSVVDNVTEKFNQFNNTADTTSEFDQNDISSNKGMAVLSYFGPLALIPLFAKKDSKFAQFHAKQGINLLIVDIIYVIISNLLGLIKVTKTDTLWGIPYEVQVTPWYINLITFLMSVFIAVLAIIGIVNAVKGKAKELPLIGGIKILK